ncbi:MAG: neutral/alkaline non-lysosomal ceramidase N-terminal domain-containing protein [Kiritimatiellia bacterium]
MIGHHSHPLCLSVFFCFVLGATLQAGDWKVGLAAEDITPAEPIYLAGHATSDRISESVLHPIRVKAMVLEDASGSRAAIVAADIFGMQRPKTDEVWARIEQRTGLSRERVAINATHCHALPLLAGTLPPAYRVLVEPPEHWEVIERYTLRVQDAMVEAVVRALAVLQPATLEYGQDACDIRNKDADIKPYVDEINRDRPFYDVVPVLRVKDDNGALLAILFGYPTHAQASGEAVHAGYMGYACLALETNYPGVHAMFLLGTGALTTIRGISYSVWQPQASEETGVLLAQAVIRALGKPMQPIGGGAIVCAADEVELPFATPVARPELLGRRRSGRLTDPYMMRRDEFLIDFEKRNGHPLQSYRAIQQVMRIGGELTFIFMSGEVSEGYSYRLAEIEYPGRRLWINGFSNDLFGYIPTEGVLTGPACRVGGASQIYWGWPSKWATGIENRIVGKIRDMLE